VSWAASPKPVTYGNLLLGPPRRYSAPKTAARPTVDGVINPAEYPGAPKSSSIQPEWSIRSAKETKLDGRRSKPYSFRVVHTTDASMSRGRDR